jgi:ABC-type spermidine/putrescine transport system permease subunit II
MNEGMSVLVGMSIAYVASFIGMIVAYIAWRRRRREKTGKENREPRD